jgi:hypothetical protein
MIQFDVRLLVLRMRHIEQVEEELLAGKPTGNDDNTPVGLLMAPLRQWTPSNSPDELLTKNGALRLWSAYLSPLQNELKPLDLKISQNEIQHMWNHSHLWTAKEMAVRLKEFRLKLTNELNDRFFVYLTPDEALYFREVQPFGAEVATSFPSAEIEIAEAAKCFATGRNTASVFHCMRVLETGLRLMASDLDVIFDVQSWGPVIGEIEAKIKTLDKLPRGVDKSERLQQLSEAAKEFTYFKDAWRNHVSHNRTTYDADQAKSVLNHVKDFMATLSRWLKE